MNKLEQNPGAEEALDSLIDLETSIEDAIFDILKNYKNQDISTETTNIYKSVNGGNIDLRNKIESRIMQIFTGQKVSVNDFHQKFIDKISSILAIDSIEDILKNLNINYKNIKKTILIPGLMGNGIGNGDGSFEKKEGYNKFGMLIELLIEGGIYTDDLYIINGENMPSQMRKESYLYIYIPRLDKTILLNNGYGERTYIYNGVIDVDHFTKQSKNNIKQNKKIDVINFNYKNPEKWTVNMKDILFKNKIKNKVNIDEYVKNMEINKFKEFFKEEGDINYWKNKIQEKREDINILGYKLTAISRKLGIKEGSVLYSNEVWFDMLEIIFDEKIERIKQKKLTKKGIVNYFKKEGNIDYRKKKTKKDKRKLKISGYGLTAISRELGIKEGTPSGNKKLWLDLLEIVFDEKIERVDLDKDFVVKYFKEKGDIDYWKNISREERNEFKLSGYGIRAIFTSLGIKESNGQSIANQKYRNDALEIVFDEKIERIKPIELTKEQIIEYFKNKGDIDYWKNIGSKKRREIKISGKGLYLIAKTLGIKELKIGYDINLWYDALEIVFDEKIERLKKETIIEYFKNKGDIDYWKNINLLSLYDIDIQGKGIIYLARELGIKEGNPANSKQIWLNMLEIIFDKKIKRLKKKSIIGYFKKEGDIDYWKNKTVNEKKNIEILGKGLFAMSRVVGMKKGHPINNKQAWYDMLEIVFK